MSLKHTELRKVLVSVIEVVCDEAEKNSEFADRLQKALAGIQPAKSTPRPEKRRASDPFPVLQEHGPEGLRRWLQEREIEELKAIIREHRLDSSGLAKKWKTPEKLVDLIVERVVDKASRGEVFRHYSGRSEPTPPPKPTSDGPPPVLGNAGGESLRSGSTGPQVLDGNPSSEAEGKA